MKASLIVALALCACSKQSSVRTTSALLAQDAEQVAYPSELSIQLAPEIYQECSNVSPRFSWDHSATHVQYRAELTAVASCLNRPSLQTERLLLVGRAYSRESSTSNYAAGMGRAHAIKTFLARIGLDPDRIDVSALSEDGTKADVIVKTR